MKRLHRFWHRLIWSLLLPVLAAALLLGEWLRPPVLSKFLPMSHWVVLRWNSRTEPSLNTE